MDTECRKPLGRCCQAKQIAVFATRLSLRLSRLPRLGNGRVGSRKAVEEKQKHRGAPSHSVNEGQGVRGGRVCGSEFGTVHVVGQCLSSTAGASRGRKIALVDPS
jgi:hypothetical protein